MRHMLRDFRYGIRTLRRNPGFATAAILTLGLGLGANMAIFRFVDAVLLQSLPVHNPDELVLVRPWNFSYPEYRQFSEQNADVFDRVAARWTIRVNLTADGTTEYVPGELVSGTYFETLGVTAAIGRLLNQGDDGAEGAHPVCVISYGLWQRRFAGQPHVVGRMIELNAKPFEMVREAPQITLYFPVAQRPNSELTLHARVTGSTATAIAGLAGSVRQIDPRVPVYNAGVLEDHVNARLANERVLNVLSLLFASLSLLVACAGLYGLVSYTVVRRTREIGIRLAVGARRSHILRLLLTDLMAVVGLGIVVGIPLALAAGRQFGSVLYGVEPSSLSTLLPAAALLALVAAGAAAVPAARATTLDPISALREQ